MQAVNRELSVSASAYGHRVEVAGPRGLMVHGGRPAECNCNYCIVLPNKMEMLE